MASSPPNRVKQPCGVAEFHGGSATNFDCGAKGVSLFLGDSPFAFPQAEQKRYPTLQVEFISMQHPKNLPRGLRALGTLRFLPEKPQVLVLGASYLDPQTTHKNGISPTIILGVKPNLKIWKFEGPGASGSMWGLTFSDPPNLAFGFFLLASLRRQSGNFPNLRPWNSHSARAATRPEP